MGSQFWPESHCLEYVQPILSEDACVILSHLLNCNIVFLEKIYKHYPFQSWTLSPSLESPLSEDTWQCVVILQLACLFFRSFKSFLYIFLYWSSKCWDPLGAPVLTCFSVGVLIHVLVFLVEGFPRKWFLRHTLYFKLYACCNTKFTP